DAKHHRHQDENNKLRALHRARNGLRLKRARPRPESATTAGMAAMLSHFTRVSSESISARTCFRTVLSSLFTSASFFWKLASSCCCSGERIKRWPDSLPFCNSFIFFCVSERLVSSSLILLR